MDISEELDVIDKIESCRKPRENVWSPQLDELQLLCQPTTPAAASTGGVIFVGYNWGGPSPQDPFHPWERPRSSELTVQRKPIWNPAATYDCRAGYVTGVFDKTDSKHARENHSKAINRLVYRAECLLWPSNKMEALDVIKDEEPDIWELMKSVSLSILKKKLLLSKPTTLVAAGRETQKILRNVTSGVQVIDCYNLGRMLGRFVKHENGQNIHGYLQSLRDKAAGPR